MKNMLISKLCVCLIFLLACKKEQQPISPSPSIKTDEKKFAVEFNIAEFWQQVESMALNGSHQLMSAPGITAADSLKNHINNLLYLAYDSAGNEVGRIRQYTYKDGYKYNYWPYDSYWKVYNKPFGSIVDSLPAGKYTVIFIGSTYDFLINSRYKEDPAPDDREKLQTALIAEESTLSWRISYTGDTFVKKFTINVADPKIQQDVTLDRITGKLEVNILDAIPAVADQFEFRFVGAGSGITLSNMRLFGATYYDESDVPPFPLIQIKPSDKGKTNYQYTKFLFGGSTTPIEVTVEIRCHDTNGHLMASKIVTGVPIYINKRTILKGKLFDTSPQVSFNVSVNSEWDPNALQVPF